LSSTSATRNRVLPHVDVDVAVMLIWFKPSMLRKVVLMVALPFSVTCDPTVEEYVAVIATFLASGRVNKALKVLLAEACRALADSVAAVFESVRAVESSAAWNAARVAFATE